MSGSTLIGRASWLSAVLLLGGFCFPAWSTDAPNPPPPSAWPQPYSVTRDKSAGLITLSTPYYTLQHDLKQGGAISSIRLTHGRALNLLVQPLATQVKDAAGNLFSDVAGEAIRAELRHKGQKEFVTVESNLVDRHGKRSGIRVKTVYEYRWGYVKIHKEFVFPSKGLPLQEICPILTVLAPSLTDYGYRDGLTEQEGAPAFSFGSCHWGTLSGGAAQALDLRYVPHYVMLADPGVEGLEWFVSSDLAQWDLQISGKRGDGKVLLQPSAGPAGVSFSVSPFDRGSDPVLAAAPLSFDFYVGLPLLEGHAWKPWLHASFNRNRGDWVSRQQIRQWAETGIQTVHCHNDGDYYDDGLFWRDGSYPPYPDMDKYDKVIQECHEVGIRVATYFSNKELHPSTSEFQRYGTNWGRMNLKGELQHNYFKAKSEFGVQMCLRSGWLDYLKLCIDRVLSQHRLDGVYYDWNVPLLCDNPKHEKLKPGQPAAGHWDIDELLNLMEWTRRRVGPYGLVIVHNTTTPMFATENFASEVVANEWGYGKWTGPGPNLQDLPLEWSLVGARPRGVISYGQLDAQAPRQLHRLFALEALLAGVTPWPASPETFELYPVLKPIGALATCRFADWRNQAVQLRGTRAASAIYSRPDEAWLLIGNLNQATDQVRCTVRLDKLPYPLSSVSEAAIVPQGNSETQAGTETVSLDVQQLTGTGVQVTVPAESAVLVHLRAQRSTRPGLNH